MEYACMKIRLVVRQLTIHYVVKRNPQTRKVSSKCNEEDPKKLEELAKIAQNPDIDDPPTTCCMSGCANCVFIVWAEALSKKMEGAGPEIANKILKLVEDPSLKAYLEMELRIRGFKVKH